MTLTSPPAAADTPPPATPKRRSSRLVTLGLVLGAVVVGLITARLLLSAFQPHFYAGTVLQSPTSAPALDGLALANGEPLDMAAFEGDVVMLYFGYTNCPDVCPTTLSTAARARESLSEADRARTQLVMVSVDPERDQIDDLQTYVEFFDADFLGAGGSAEDIHTAATRYGIYYVLNNDDLTDGEAADPNYTVDHTANLLGVAPDGSLRVIWAPDVTSDALADDLQELLG